MKKLLLLPLLCVTGIASAQTATAPFKGANTIFIQTPDSAGALALFARVLVQQGFSIDKLDKELGYLTTQERSYGQLSPAKFTYRATVQPDLQGKTLKVTGAYSVPVGLRTISESMFWTPSKMQQGRLCFDGADSAAKAYPGGVVTYGKE